MVTPLSSAVDVPLIQNLRDRLLAAVGLSFDLDLSLDTDPFNEVGEGVFVGRRPTPSDVQALKDAGITHIVSCLSESERASMAFVGVDFEPHFVAVHDGIYEDIAFALPGFFEFVDNERSKDPNTSVLVHCQAGVSRSATLVVALVMRTTGLSFYDAIRAVRARRPEVLPNIGFASQLQRLEFALRSADPPAEEESSLARYLYELCKVPVQLELLQDALHRNGYDAVSAIQSIFGGEIPRVIQGVRV